MNKTEKNNAKNNNFYYVFVFLCIIIIISIVNRDNTSLENNAKCVKAIVIDDFYGIRYTDYFRYVFIANDTVYKGDSRYYKDIETISVGDTIMIVYESTDPHNNIPLREYNKAIDCFCTKDKLKNINFIEVK